MRAGGGAQFRSGIARRADLPFSTTVWQAIAKIGGDRHSFLAMIQLPYQHHHHAQSVTSTRRFGVSWAGRWTEGIQIPPALFHVCLVRSIAILAMVFPDIHNVVQLS